MYLNRFQYLASAEPITGVQWKLNGDLDSLYIDNFQLIQWRFFCYYGWSPNGSQKRGICIRFFISNLVLNAADPETDLPENQQDSIEIADMV